MLQHVVLDLLNHSALSILLPIQRTIFVHRGGIFARSKGSVMCGMVDWRAPEGLKLGFRSGPDILILGFTLRPFLCDGGAAPLVPLFHYGCRCAFLHQKRKPLTQP